MEPNDDIASRIIASIAALPLHEQADAIHALISGALKQMPMEASYEIREESHDQFPDQRPLGRSTPQVPRPTPYDPAPTPYG